MVVIEVPPIFMFGLSLVLGFALIKILNAVNPILNFCLKLIVFLVFFQVLAALWLTINGAILLLRSAFGVRLGYQQMPFGRLAESWYHV